MAIYQGSRYINTFVYEEEYPDRSVVAFEIRRLKPINYSDASQHTWRQGDRLTTLALRYYGDARHWWFLLEANPRYMEEHEIKIGDILAVPAESELLKIVRDDSDGEG